MAKRLKFGNVVLCEHVIPSENNKFSLVNVYCGDIVVGEMPATLAFGFFIELIPQDLDPVTIVLNIFYGNKQVGMIKADVKPGKRHEVGAISIPLFMISVESEQIIKVVASSEGYPDQIVLEKKIILQAPN